MKTQISIIGCGWLGLPLAKKLIKKGIDINGSTTSIDRLKILKAQQINPFLIRLKESEISGDYSQFLTGSDTLIINIPPGLRKNPNKNHVAELKQLIHQIEVYGIKHVLYISSTSVFKNNFNTPIITENTVPNATSAIAQQLIEIEQLLQQNPHFKTTILRLAGLIDNKRHPAMYLSGKNNISNPQAPINLIHKEDAISIILHILKKELWNTTLNAAHPTHPSKKSYYTNYCIQNGIAPPQFNTSKKSKGKIIETKHLVRVLNYTFKITP